MSISTITLISNDDVKCDVDIELAKMSVTLKNMIEDLGAEAGAEIPIQNVTGDILTKVIEWCEQHRNDPDPDSDDSDDDDDYKEKHVEITEWDEKFLEVDQSTLFEIILAANFLNISHLLNVACKTVANMMKGKNAEEIRTLFSIENDFTPEEEAEIKRQNNWTN